MNASRRLIAGVVLALVVTAGLLSVQVAESRAMDAESAYVTAQLESASCLSDWGINEGAGPSADASVTGVTASGVRVSVTLPYAYTVEREGEPLFADTASRAVYEVSLTGTRRVRGDTISPC